MKHKLVVAFVLIFVPLQTIGLYVRSSTISSLGFTSLLSPFPYVFSRVQGLEVLAQSYYIRLNFTDGTNKEIEMDNKGFSKLDYRSYYTKSVILRNLSLAPILSLLRDKSYFEVSKSMICSDSLIKEAYYPNKKVRFALISTVQHTTDRNHKLKINCEAQDES